MSEVSGPHAEGGSKTSAIRSSAKVPRARDGRNPSQGFAKADRCLRRSPPEEGARVTSSAMSGTMYAGLRQSPVRGSGLAGAPYLIDGCAPEPVNGADDRREWARQSGV